MHNPHGFALHCNHNILHLVLSIVVCAFRHIISQFSCRVSKEVSCSPAKPSFLLYSIHECNFSLICLAVHLLDTMAASDSKFFWRCNKLSLSCVNYRLRLLWHSLGNTKHSSIRLVDFETLPAATFWFFYFEHLKTAYIMLYADCRCRVMYFYLLWGKKWVTHW